MDKATQIAKDNLHACFRNDGIVASIDHFSDFWARDSFFASWGLLVTGETERVKSNLELFIKYQKKNGQIPRRIDRCVTGLHYLGFKIKRKMLSPKYAGAHLIPALDPNLLLIITSHRYITKTDDQDFLKRHFGPLNKAMDWLRNYEKDGMLYEGALANWMDTVVKKGTVFYTNVLYAEALRSLSDLCLLAGKRAHAESYHQKYKELKAKLNAEFWNGHYYIDWVDGRKRFDYFSTDGNVLAILFGMVSEKQVKKIIETIEKNWLDVIPMRTNHPEYPWKQVAFWMFLRGTSGYQNAYASWLWLGSVYAVALDKNGYHKKAERIHKRMASIIEKYGAVYETYSPTGEPYKGWLWTSTKSFAWSAGLFLWADNQLGKSA